MQNTHLKIDLNPLVAAEKIQRLKTAITFDFIESAKGEIEGMRKLNIEGIIDSLPVFLDNLMGALRAGPTPQYSQTNQDIGFNHGTIRSHQRHFSLEDIFHEYRILARVIFRRLREDAEVAEETEEILRDAIFKYLGNAIRTFTADQEIREKDFKTHSQSNLARELEKNTEEIEEFFRDAHTPMFITVGRKHRLVVSNPPFEDFMNTKPSEYLENSLLKQFLDQSFADNEPLYENIGLADNTRIKVYLHPYHDRKGSVKGIRGMIERSGPSMDGESLS